LNPKGMGKKEDPRFDCSNQWHLHEDLVEWGVHLPHELRERVQLVGYTVLQSHTAALMESVDGRAIDPIASC
jgi:hypothetical protein